MNFRLTQSQQMTRRAVREFVRKEVEPIAPEIDAGAKFPKSSYRQALALEVLELTLPEALGGLDDDFLSFVIALEEFACGSAALANCIAATEAVVHLLSRYGNKEQHRQYLPPLLAGETFGSPAIGLPDEAGSPNQQLRAVPDKDGFRLNGILEHVPFAAEANLAVVFATIDNEGIGAFIVEKQMPGFVAAATETLMGVRGFPLGRLELKDVRITDHHLLGEKELGQTIYDALAMRSEAAAGTIAVGISQAALEASVRHSKTRVQFGKPIAEMVATQNKIADMTAGIASARLLVYEASFFLERPKQTHRQTAMAKFIASDLAVDICREALQIHGGYGYTKDYPVERYYRDALFSQIYPTPNESQRRAVARYAYRKIR